MALKRQTPAPATTSSFSPSSWKRALKPVLARFLEVRDRDTQRKRGEALEASRQACKAKAREALMRLDEQRCLQQHHRRCKRTLLLSPTTTTGLPPPLTPVWPSPSPPPPPPPKPVVGLCDQLRTRVTTGHHFPYVTYAEASRIMARAEKEAQDELNAVMEEEGWVLDH